MTPPKAFRARREGSLLLVRSAVSGINGKVGIVRFLVDTGVSHPLLPVETLTALGCNLEQPLNRLRIIAANGIIVAPVVSVPWFSCLGQRFEDFQLVGHTLPSGTLVDGLLGMDFLMRGRAVIRVADVEIVVG